MKISIGSIQIKAKASYRKLVANARLVLGAKNRLQNDGWALTDTVTLIRTASYFTVPYTTVPYAQEITVFTTT